MAAPPFHLLLATLLFCTAAAAAHSHYLHLPHHGHGVGVGGHPPVAARPQATADAVDTLAAGDPMRGGEPYREAEIPLPPPVVDEPFRDAASPAPPSRVVDDPYRDAAISAPPPVVDEPYPDVVCPPPPIHDDAARVASTGTGDDLGLQQIAKVLASLGYNEMASSATLLADSTPVVTCPWAITVFAVPDAILHRSCTEFSRRHLLLDHMALGYFPYAELAVAPAMKPPSASVGFCLDVAAQPQREPFSVHHASLYVDGVMVSEPELYDDGRYVVHGLHGFIPPLSHASCVEDAHAHHHHQVHLHHYRRLHHLSARSAATSAATAASVVRIKIQEAHLRDSGFGFVALAMRVKFPELEKLSNLTVFALDDQFIFTGGGHGYVSAVRFHIVPGHRLTRADLLLLRPGTVLPTLAGEDQKLVITLGAGSATDKVRVNYIPVKEPDVVINSRVAVHGIYLPFPLAAWVAVALLALKAAQNTQAGHLRVLACMFLVACSISVATAAAPAGCDSRAGATKFGLLCTTRKPSEGCCEWVLNATQHAGVGCLCWVAASVRFSGYGAASVLAIYQSCGGPLDTSGGCKGGSIDRERSSIMADEGTPNKQHRYYRHRKFLPPPHHHHRKTPHAPRVPRHRKKRHATVVADEEESVIEEESVGDAILRVTHHHQESSSLKSKLETAGIIIVIIVVPLAVLTLVCYVLCVGAGDRQARARMVLHMFTSFLPHILAAWRGSPAPVQPTFSELVMDHIRNYGVPVQTENNGTTTTNSGAIVRS